MLTRLKTYRYEIIAALSGATVMILELVGARMMAPFFGTSTYVWTAMIGVILGALSFGYWYGGRLADRGATDKGLMLILISASLVTALGLILQSQLFPLVASLRLDVRISAIISALLLFAPASALLGIVSPYVAKLKLSSLKTAGSSIGRLYAAGTIGSIVGTFLTGYWLIALLGNFTLGIVVVITLVLISFIAERHLIVIPRIIGLVALGGLLYSVGAAASPGVISDTDSSYARYQVIETNQSNGLPVRYLLMDNIGAQSGVAIGNPDLLLFPYTQKFNEVANAYGAFRNALVIGGGAYTFPGVLARERPGSHVDVVEIDPALDLIAERYFGYTPQPNLALIHEDGRTYLNRNTTKYDLLYIDAFSSLTPPYQLTTREATERMKQSLSDKGIVAVNVIASPNADDPYFTATYATYRAVFPEVQVYQLNDTSVDERQNLLFIARNDRASIPGSFKYPLDVTTVQGMVLTDDHAPVEQLIQESEGS